MENEKKISIYQLSPKILKETIATANSCETNTSTFYQTNPNANFERKRSRLGSKLYLLEEQLSIEYENMLEKVHDDINENIQIFDENTQENKNEESQYLTEEICNMQIFININILICTKNKNIKKEPEKFLSSLTLKVDEDIKIDDILRISVDEFNQKFRNENFKYLLNNNNYDNYKIKPSKKNGHPNNYIPAFDRKEKVIKTNFTNFSLIYAENDLIKNNFTKKSKCIQRCLIM